MLTNHYSARYSLFLALTAMPVAAFAQQPRDLFITPASPGRGSSAPAHPAVRFRIELDNNGHSEAVPSSHRFHSGDRFRFSFELNSPLYIYVINRSIEGNPDTMRDMLGTRGLNVVNSNPGSGSAAPAAPKMQLLWPQAGGNARLAGNQTQTIPGPTQFLQFDSTPGMEKISLLISPRPVDPAIFFPALGRRPAPSAPGPRLDTNEEVLAQLDDVGTLDSNTTTDTGESRGICVGDCSQYSAPKNPAQPFILTVDLLHAR